MIHHATSPYFANPQLGELVLQRPSATVAVAWVEDGGPRVEWAKLRRGSEGGHKWGSTWPWWVNLYSGASLPLWPLAAISRGFPPDKTKRPRRADGHMKVGTDESDRCLFRWIALPGNGIYGFNVMGDPSALFPPIPRSRRLNLYFTLLFYYVLITPPPMTGPSSNIYRVSVTLRRWPRH